MYSHKTSFSVEPHTKGSAINLALDTIKIGKQALVFVNSKRSAEKHAEDIAKKNASEPLKELSEGILTALSKPTKQCKRLAKCVINGVAFHHAGLVAKQRELIEDAFRDGKIKVICCTPTLAAGVDLPAFRTIIKDLKRYTSWGMRWIPVLEYLQMAGRAGRPGMEDYGEAIVIANTDGDHSEIKEVYLNGEPEKIYSKLAVEPVLRMHLLALIVTGIVRDKKQIMDFFSKTFWAHQYQDMDKLEAIIVRVLQLLKEYGFVQLAGSAGDFVAADEMVIDSAKPTLIGTRVSQLYIDPYTANHLIESMQQSDSKEYDDFAILQMVCYTFEMRPLLRVRSKDYEDIDLKVVECSDKLLAKEPTMYDPEYDEFLNSLKTAMMINDWIEEKDEDYLNAHYGATPGEIHAKIDRTDWLLYTAVELAKIKGLKKITNELMKMRVRVQYGVREELLPLLHLKNIGRARARKLFNSKVKNVGDIKRVDITILAQLVGKAIALDIKKQVGAEVVVDDKLEKELDKHKQSNRKPKKKKDPKGQISLLDY